MRARGVGCGCGAVTDGIFCAVGCGRGGVVVWVEWNLGLVKW